ncbi:MAG: hypothetical protein WA990_12735 [Rubrobacteraceae bacterium]
MLRKLLVFAVMFALASGMLVACGGEEGEDEDEDSSAGQKKPATAGETQPVKTEPIDAVQVAYEKTAAEQSARVEFTTVTSGIPTGATTPNGPESMEFRMNGKGVVGLTGQKARMTMQMGPLGSFEFRMLGDAAYYKMPQDGMGPTPGMKPWVKTDLDSFYEQQYGASFSEMQANNPTDPTKQLEALKDVGSVEKVGRERIRGAETTHYRAVMDLRKAAAQEGPEVKKAYDEMIEQMGTSEIPMEVWLDEQGHARRFAMDMTTTVPLPAQDPSAGGATTEEKVRVTMTEDIFDFGVPVNVSLPPSEKTMSQKEFERQMQQQIQQQPVAAAAKS